MREKQVKTDQIFFEFYDLELSNRAESSIIRYFKDREEPEGITIEDVYSMSIGELLKQHNTGSKTCIEIQQALLGHFYNRAKASEESQIEMFEKFREEVTQQFTLVKRLMVNLIELSTIGKWANEIKNDRD